MTLPGTLRRGAPKRIVLSALRDGPKTTREVASGLQAVKPRLGTGRLPWPSGCRFGGSMRERRVVARKERAV